MTPSFLHRAGGLLAVAAIAVPVAGCGGASSSSGASSDPAHLLPASSPIYLEARVRPDGDLKANVDAVAGKILRTSDPGQKITELIDKGLAKHGGSYKQDVEPWLGDRAGMAITRLSSGRDSAEVAAIASKDDDKARAFIDKRGGAKKSYRGVDYRLDAKDDTAGALVDHMVLVGGEADLKAAIDVSKGAAKLSDAKAFKEARDTVATDGLGFMYVNPTRFFDAAFASTPGLPGGSQAQLLKGVLGGSGLRSIAASLEVAQDALRVDGAVIGVKSARAGGDGPGAAADVPADAWLSAGVGDLGTQVNRGLTQMSQSGAIPGMNPAQLLQGLQSGLGVDVQKDFLSWMGDAAVFVRGTSLSSLQGAVIVHSKDPAASQRAVGTLRRLLPQLGVKRVGALRAGGVSGLRVSVGRSGREIDIAAKGDRFVVALGRGALTDALAGGQRLGDTDAYKQAAGLLGGEKASMFLDVPRVVTLLGSLPRGGASLAQARPTLEAFGPAAAGVSSSGDVTHLKAAVAVK